MLAHRFQELVRSTSTVPAFAGAQGMMPGCAFVSCPLYAGLSPLQQGVIQEVYRRAAEITVAELTEAAASTWNGLPAFSVN